ncbi:substrate-binding domain-containing protein [Micromonospora sp. CB01531]|uniref:substrate-binding domain-containing protein n=1 Tax=Micromonospora sp. CB01531 TaxID=1718947 RepID=UPI00093D061D|nr:substrate-binding domain-containing protein [Micromonospora sp. CB01531]OKI85095.1 hypothetical protein A6A27_14925 [Micromonospora sp. CB01531]
MLRQRCKGYLLVAALSDSPLTSVAIDSEAMARYAATVLLRRLDDRPAPGRAGPAAARLVHGDFVRRDRARGDRVLACLYIIDSGALTAAGLV